MDNADKTKSRSETKRKSRVATGSSKMAPTSVAKAANMGTPVTTIVSA
jgi:hypothetical protein